MKKPTDAFLNFLSNPKGTGEKVKAKVATETRRRHKRRRQKAAFSQQLEIGSEELILIDFPQDSMIKLKLSKFQMDLIYW